MKKITLLVIIAIASLSFVSAQNTAVPDAEFEQALLDLGLDVDLTINGQVPTGGIENVTSLDVSGKNISDLTGIEGFAALQVLNCSNNNLTALNIDANQDLQQLDCSNNTIGPFINTEFNQDLVNINASNNNLTSFVLEFNTILTNFNISNNNGIINLDLSLLGNLASLNLDNMSALEQLNIANSNNGGITTFSALNTPKLFCTNVSNVAFAEANWTNRDGQNAYSTSCFYDGFITTWKTDNPGDTADDSIGIATNGAGYNYAVNWGDGTIETGITGNALHTYATPGTYIVQISGAFPRINGNGSPFNNAKKIIALNQWGNIQWTSFEDAFSTAKNMVGNFTDAPDLSNVTNMFGMFSNAESFNSPIANWDVSNVINMSNMFIGTKAFNQPLDSWIVSNVTDMSNMFFDADAFNQPLNSWNVSNVANMSEMFANSDAFNQPLNNWNVSNVTDINNMFKGAKVFNQPLDNWTLTSVTDGVGLLEMFFNAEAFNQSLASWDVSNIQDMTRMLTGTALSTENYDATLIAWDALPSVQNNVTLGANAVYCNSETARTSLQAKGWTINDNGFLCVNVIESFNTTWQTTTANESITIPTTGGGYNYDVDWGDGIIETGFTGDASHTYAAVGTYTVKISGAFPRIYFNDTGDKDKIVSIEQWGAIAWINMSDAFEGCINLQVNATDAPDLSGVVNLSKMFRYCTTLNANFNNWDVSAVKFMSAMFEGATSFNGQIGGWTTTSLQTANNMFRDAINFNQNISGWNMSSVTSVRGMFLNAQIFNQPIGSWMFDNVSDMREMFNNAKQFNQPIENWDVSTVTTMFGMFNGADSFDKPLDGWNVGNVTTMINMFNGADVFNQPLNSWNVSNVNSMINMFNDAGLFNQPLDNWNVSNVNNMNNMFRDATAFNQSLATWDVSNVTTMNSMFNGITLSTANYDATLIGWNNLPSLQNSVNFGGSTSLYCYSQVERQNIIDTYGWTINDGGIDATCPNNVDVFITTWQTTSANETITIPTTGGGYNYDIDWGDGTIETGFTTNATHTYASAGSYQVEISGAFPRIYFNNSGDKDKIQSIDQWGTIAWTSMADAFYGCSNLVINTPDAPDLSNATATGGMFWEATSLTGGVANWNMSTITFMTDMFNGASSFNENISNWNVSNVTHMDGMFRGATAFDQDLIWNTNSLRFTRFMFNDASNFNGNITAWQVDTLEEMDAMFKGASAFNQDISGWITSNVREMDQAFSGATAFNQPIGSWNTAMVTEMQSMFLGATAFNQDLSNWNVDNVQQMQNMFDGATAFNQSLATWDVGLVGNMDGMFNGVTLSTPNYDATLIAWANLPLLQDSVPFDGGNSQYCEAEQVRFDVLAGTYNWTITDGGVDLTPPTVICQNITVNLDIYGNVTITPAQIDNGSSTSCGDLTLTLDITQFTCDDIGDNTVVLTASNLIGNSVSCSATVTVQDTTSPTVEAYDQEFTLDATGNLTLTAEDVLRTNGFFAVAKNGIGSPPVNAAFFDYDATTDTVALNKEYEDVFPANSNVYAMDGNPVNGKVYAIASVDPFPNVRILYQINLNEDEFGTAFVTQLVSSTGNAKPTGMSFGVDGNLYVVFQDGVIESYNFDTGALSPYATVGTTASAQGLTYDYDNNRLLYVKNSNPVELFEISLPDGVVTPLFNFSIDLGNGACSAQAVEYAGNNKLIVSATQSNGALCDGIYKVDLTTQATEVLLTPTGTINEIKDILLPYYGDACGPYTASIDVTDFNCENVGLDNTVNVTFTDANGNSSAVEEISVYVLNNPNNQCGATVSPIAILQGAALNPNVGEETLMRDDLRVAGLIPTTSPYVDQLTTSPTSFDVVGDDAIVDWVYVELRDAIDPTIIIGGQSALIQRDGDIINRAGFPVTFNIVEGSYHVVVKHRNHLAVMSNFPIPLSNASIQVNFTDANNPIGFGVNPQTDFGLQGGTVAMWAGNVSGDTVIQYSGTTPETPSILSEVLNDAGNFLNFPTYVVNGYNVHDINMDGNTQYSGTNPDTPFILQNVLVHPGNFLNFSTYQIQEQLPEN